MQIHLVNNRREESHSSNVIVNKDALLFIATFLTKKQCKELDICIFGNIVRLYRDGILSPAIDSKESIPPAYVALCR
jgi:hypothetical protein